MGTDTAFAMGLITSGLQWVMVMLSWILTSYLGRRTIYVWGSAINVAFLVALGIAGSVGRSTAASLAQASLGLIVSVLFTLGPPSVSGLLQPVSDVLHTTRSTFPAFSSPVTCSTPRYDSPPPEFLLQLVANQTTGGQSWWQVRLCLGRNWFRLLCPGILLPA
jgi:hypothetical protein